MKEIGIIFSTPMVQAILENRKSMTRRVIKTIPKGRTDFVHTSNDLHFRGSTDFIWAGFGNPEDPVYFKCPYGQPGDRLYVKETWKVMFIDEDKLTMLIAYKADDEYKTAQFSPERFEKFRKFFGKNGWQSPYFMPKEAARLWLDNKSVRVERLQEITEEDAIKEGIDATGLDTTALEEFQGLWEHLNKKRGHGWDNNNWLWVVSFRRVEK